MTIDNYDKDGNKTEWLGYFAKSYPVKFVFVCDDKGKLVQELSYNFMDEIEGEAIYNYSADNTLAEEIIIIANARKILLEPPIL